MNRSDNQERPSPGSELQKTSPSLGGSPDALIATVKDEAIYTLREVRDVLGLSQRFMIHLASRRDIRVAVLVPPGMRVFSIDPYSVELDGADWGARKFIEKIAPDQGMIPRPLPKSIRALVLSPGECRFVADFIFVDLSLFAEAIDIPGVHGIGGSPAPIVSRPPKLMAVSGIEGQKEIQRDSFFGVYRRDEAFEFRAEVGFKAPEEVRAEADCLVVTGFDLNRVIDAVNQAAGVGPAGERSTEEKSPSVKRKRKATVDSDRKKAKGLSEEDHGLRILRLDEVLDIVGVSESTLYNFYDKNHPSYDPGFPSQIAITNRRMGWLAAEILEWMKGRPRVGRR
jgi:prophage regulatory protein